MGREENEKETICLMQGLAKEDIGFVAFLGDMVSRNSEGNWNFFMGLISP